MGPKPSAGVITPVRDSANWGQSKNSLLLIGVRVKTLENSVQEFQLPVRSFYSDPI